MTSTKFAAFRASVGLLDALHEIADPVERERAAREGVIACRQVRAEAIQELYRKLGSWEKVGDAVGLPRQDAWRLGAARSSS